MARVLLLIILELNCNEKRRQNYKWVNLRKLVYIKNIFVEVSSFLVSLSEHASLVYVTSWWWTVDKPLSKLMMTPISYVYISVAVCVKCTCVWVCKRNSLQDWTNFYVSQAWPSGWILLIILWGSIHWNSKYDCKKNTKHKIICTSFPYSCSVDNLLHSHLTNVSSHEIRGLSWTQFHSRKTHQAFH